MERAVLLSGDRTKRQTETLSLFVSSSDRREGYEMKSRDTPWFMSQGKAGSNNANAKCEGERERERGVCSSSVFTHTHTHTNAHTHTHTTQTHSFSPPFLRD